MSSGAGRDVQGAAESCLPLLLEKLGETNVRLKDASQGSIMFLAGLKEANLKVRRGEGGWS